MEDILAIDVGTTLLKVGIFSPDLEEKLTTSRRYQVNLYDQGKADVQPEEWWLALKSCCAELREHLPGVGVISLSVTTPGLVPMDEDGLALGPAILFFDGRSRYQAKAIRERVGEEFFLNHACNLPVSGGSSLASILWIRENQPEIWDKVAKFGHTNTYLVKRLTGHWAIDPSTTSITGLYNSACNDLTWNEEVLFAAEIPERFLPPLVHSHNAVGEILPSVAEELHLSPKAIVLCGGNDAVLGSLSGDIVETGVISNINGTCEITTVCVDHPVCSPNFNVRCHVIPGLWLTFFILNTGGSALEWFHQTFCKDMTREQFFNEFAPSAIKNFINSPDIDALEQEIPVYIPFLQGSRYSLDLLTAGFQGLTLETTREQLLLSVIKGNETYHAIHIKELSGMIKMGSRVLMTGGGAKIEGIVEVKKRWMGDFEYVFQNQSSLRGAAMLGQYYQRGYINLPPTT
ncbi:MAG: hypothetical protein A2029_17175 [Chloroflexi bacterium RBG_19FT_COMBO_47_9]|nr:MAG: hypothetical protein A2029_17175 [Chloroflexi bacterium RBG_19FT_COMBO_47_9]